MTGSIAAILTLGFGSWGSPGLVTTLGYGAATAAVPNPVARLTVAGTDRTRPAVAGADATSPTVAGTDRTTLTVAATITGG